MTKLKFYRENQGLDRSFVSEILKIEEHEYTEIENQDFSIVESKMQEAIAKIFGVNKEFFFEKKKTNKIPNGFARSYSQISEKDKSEINKLITLKKMYMREKCNEKNFN